MLIGRETIDLAAKDCGGFTALHIAAELGHDKIVAMLLEKNSKLVAIQGHNKLTPLHLAVIEGHPTVVKRLLATLLQFAVEYGHEEIVEILVESVKSKSEGFGKAMFYCAISKGYDRIATQLLVASPRLIDDANCFKETALHLAARYGRDMIVGQLLVEQPHLIEKASNNGETALHVAAESGHEKIVSQLLAAKPALASQKKNFGSTPLHDVKCEKIAALLLAHNPELIDATTRYGDNALDMAVRHGNDKVVECLLAHGATGVNASMLWNALRMAKEANQAKIVSMLLTHKPELIESVDEANNTVLHGVFRPSISKELVQRVYQLTPREALRKLNSYKEDPLCVAIKNFNESATELVQWHFSFDEITETFGKYHRACPQPLLDQIYGYLLDSLNKDVVGIIWDCLLVGRTPRDKRTTTRTKFDPRAIR